MFTDNFSCSQSSWWQWGATSWCPPRPGTPSPSWRCWWWEPWCSQTPALLRAQNSNKDWIEYNVMSPWEFWHILSLSCSPHCRPTRWGGAPGSWGPPWQCQRTARSLPSRGRRSNIPRCRVAAAEFKRNRPSWCQTSVMSCERFWRYWFPMPPTTWRGNLSVCLLDDWNGGDGGWPEQTHLNWVCSGRGSSGQSPAMSNGTVSRDLLLDVATIF